jgi:general secretion pathway protein H
MRPARARRGFTLIELVIALSIVVVLFGAVIYGVGALTGARAKESSAELAGAIRSMYDTAALSGKTCRIVFELPGERDEETPVTYRAECARSGIAVAGKRDDELREATTRRDKKDQVSDDDARFRRMSRDSAPTAVELMAREEKRVEDQTKFSSFDSEEVPPRTLPSSVQIEVWTQKQHNPVKHGTAYLYFFPQGFTERAQVYVRQGPNVWTLAVSPLNGKVVIASEALEVPHS